MQLAYENKLYLTTSVGGYILKIWHFGPVRFRDPYWTFPAITQIYIAYHSKFCFVCLHIIKDNISPENVSMSFDGDQSK